MAGEFGKIAVLMGGASAEREISLISGKAVLEALRKAGVEAYGFDPAAQPIWRLADERPERVFIALHGGAGEDGTIQAALDLLQIPYTGSGVLACALAMDKRRTTLIWRALGLPVPRSLLVADANAGPAVAAELGLPLIIKPVREGSSLGVVKVQRLEEFATAFAAARHVAGHAGEVMAEEFISGIELTAAVLGRRVLPLIRIEAPEGRYDYQNKYFTDAVRYHCPAGIDAAKEAEIAASVLTAYDALGCRGWGRADLILQPEGGFRLLEMNTSPGMTSHSLVPMAAKAAGIDFTSLVLAILAEAQYG